MSQAGYVLSEALRLIDTESKWSPKGPGTARNHGDEGCRCILVAIQHAYTRARLSQDHYREAYDTVLGLIPEQDRKQCLGGWNDAPGRTYAEVMTLLTKAKEVANGEAPNQAG